jgi:hypothetical protein
MATHPKTPLDPANPIKSRHIVERCANNLTDNRGAIELMQADALRVLTWLGEAPLRSLNGEGMRAWVKSQSPPWSGGYWQAIRRMVQGQLAERLSETSQDVKTKLMTVTERLLPECREVALSGGDLVIDRRAPEYRRWMELKSVEDAWAAYDRRRADYVEALNRQSQGGTAPGPAPTEPRWPRLSAREADQMNELGKCLPYLTTINHTAALGYLKFQASLAGLTAEKHQHLHLHRAIEQGGDLSEVPESELKAAIAAVHPKEPTNAQ